MNGGSSSGDTAALYGVSADTVYRALRERLRPKALRRADYGKARKLPIEEMERYREVIAALKVRTTIAKQGCSMLQPLIGQHPIEAAPEATARLLNSRR